MTKFPDCDCGGKAKYVDNGPFIDQYKCTGCGWETKCYYDGAEYAISDWNRRLNPPPLSTFEKILLKRLQEKENEWKKYSDRS